MVPQPWREGLQAGGLKVERTWVVPLNKGASGTSLDLYISIDLISKYDYTEICLAQLCWTQMMEFLARTCVAELSVGNLPPSVQW